jgi:hypothetical protein
VNPHSKSSPILAAITDVGVARRILACLGLPPRAPPIVGARPWPSQVRRPGQGEPAPDPLESDFEFDQSLPEAWDVGA